MDARLHVSRLSGQATVPPSKSAAHRAVLCAALADGVSHITNIEYSQDIRATLGAVTQLGAKVAEEPAAVTITGRGSSGGFVTVTRPVFCNESGSTLRFMIPLFSLTAQKVRFTGAGRLFDRPQAVYQMLFDRQGLRFEQTPEGVTVFGRLAKDLGYVYVDTGAMYRSIGLYAVRAGVDPKDEAAVTALLPQIKLAIRLVDGAQHIYLNGEDVSDAIRAENIGMAASAVSAHPPVRAFLLDTQRGLAADQNILMDGRDIGTVVLPNATVKIFLTASAEARAERRRKELEEKGQPADFATVLADIRQRDYQDTHRAIAPLKQADDAILVDTSDIGFDESFELLKRTILAHI